MSNRFQTALDIQNACNPSGVAHEFLRQCEAFRASPDHTGTTSLRNDPALQLIAYKLCDLMGGMVDGADYAKAYDACARNAAP